MKHIHIIVALVFSMAITSLGLSVSNVFAATMEEKVSEHIKPVGSLCMAGDPCAASQLVVRSVNGVKKTGDQIYNANCVACHASGAAGAPIVGSNEASATAWAPRINKGIDTLFANSIGGINAMPAMGLCMDCTDEDIKITVCHMINTVLATEDITEEVQTACEAVENTL